MRTGKWPVIWLMAAGLATMAGCQRGPDLEEARRQILEIHRRLIAAHLQNNPGYFGRDLADGFLSVKNGEITRPTAVETVAGIEAYILETQFAEYRDLEEPVIGFSRDATLAWAAVRVQVRGVRTPPGGPPRPVDFVCAWLTLYEKTGRGWKTRAEVSTFK